MLIFFWSFDHNLVFLSDARNYYGTIWTKRGFYGTKMAPRGVILSLKRANVKFVVTLWDTLTVSVVTA
jgi:hypothetical protein